MLKQYEKKKGKEKKIIDVNTEKVRGRDTQGRRGGGLLFICLSFYVQIIR